MKYTQDVSLAVGSYTCRNAFLVDYYLKQHETNLKKFQVTDRKEFEILVNIISWHVL
jgi:hypothetical protein